MSDKKFSTDEKNPDKILLMISEITGLKFLSAHKSGVERYIEKRTDELKISYKEFFELIKNNIQEKYSLINASTVNETYFFREEKQFDLIQKIISSKEKINIWSAACSSGEEVYSVKLLCGLKNIQADITASDINTDKLRILKDGLYNLKSATREIDGKKFHYLLTPYLNNETISFPEKMCNSISAERINLKNFADYRILENKKFDIILLRNVFIYFTLEERYKILNFISDNYLKNDGYIFVSLSETAQLEEKYLNENIKKICLEDVFVFHKNNAQDDEVENG